VKTITDQPATQVRVKHRLKSTPNENAMSVTNETIARFVQGNATDFLNCHAPLLEGIGRIEFERRGRGIVMSLGMENLGGILIPHFFYAALADLEEVPLLGKRTRSECREIVTVYDPDITTRFCAVYGNVYEMGWFRSSPKTRAANVREQYPTYDEAEILTIYYDDNFHFLFTAHALPDRLQDRFMADCSRTGMPENFYQ